MYLKMIKTTLKLKRISISSLNINPHINLKFLKYFFPVNQ